jgi:hypothetical protein
VYKFVFAFVRAARGPSALILLVVDRFPVSCITDDLDTRYLFEINSRWTIALTQMSLLACVLCIGRIPYRNTPK